MPQGSTVPDQGHSDLLYQTLDDSQKLPKLFQIVTHSSGELVVVEVQIYWFPLHICTNNLVIANLS